MHVSYNALSEGFEFFHQSYREFISDLDAAREDRSTILEYLQDWIDGHHAPESLSSVIPGFLSSAKAIRDYEGVFLEFAHLEAQRTLEKYRYGLLSPEEVKARMGFDEGK